MKIVVAAMTLLVLWSCSPKEEETGPKEEAVSEEEIVEKELTEEEKLMEALPEADLKDWNLILVNPKQALAEDFQPTLEEVDNEQRVDERIVDAWIDWKEAAQEAGHRLFLASAYRDRKRQENNFQAEVNQQLDEGLSEEEAFEKAKEYLTEPGHSEHHTGLALDIVDEDWIVSGRGLEEAYEEEASQQWLMETKADYGFILRYPERKEDITEIEYEPWHFRYVGPEHAAFIEENELAFEEYIELLEEAEK